MHTFNSTPAGTTIGLKESEWGQIGVTIMAGTDGCIMEAPAATAYAVLPVGVETINPSPCRKCWLFRKKMWKNCESHQNLSKKVKFIQ